MEKEQYACLITADAVAILCKRQGNWRPVPISGETSIPMRGADTVPATLKALSERLNLNDALARVVISLVYAENAYKFLPAALKCLLELGGAPREMLRINRLGATAHEADPAAIMERFCQPMMTTAPSAAKPVCLAPSTSAAAGTRAAAKPAKKRFYTVDPGASQPALVYDSSSGLLWSSRAAAEAPVLSRAAEQLAGNLRLAGQAHWRLPLRHELADFAAAPQPLRSAHSKTLLEHWNWLCVEGRLDVVKSRLTPDPDASGYLLPVLDLARGKPADQFMELARLRGWQVAPWDA